MTQSKNTPSSTDDNDDLQTPVDEQARHTGQSDPKADVRPGAEPESPAARNAVKEGTPNQGTEAR